MQKVEVPGLFAFGHGLRGLKILPLMLSAVRQLQMSLRGIRRCKECRLCPCSTGVWEGCVE
jgi:hypothetical protein